MGAEQGFFDSLRGNRRVRMREKHIERISEDFDSPYENSPEMIFLEEELRWEGSARLIFVMAMRNVNLRWNGTRDYGFLRLCTKWVRENNVRTVTPRIAVAMVKSILPTDMCKELGQELAALEIS